MNESTPRSSSLTQQSRARKRKGKGKEKRSKRVSDNLLSPDKPANPHNGAIRIAHPPAIGPVLLERRSRVRTLISAHQAPGAVWCCTGPALFRDRRGPFAATVDVGVMRGPGARARGVVDGEGCLARLFLPLPSASACLSRCCGGFLGGHLRVGILGTKVRCFGRGHVWVVCLSG